jgi:hypothetical protein
MSAAHAGNGSFNDLAVHVGETNGMPMTVYLGRPVTFDPPPDRRTKTGSTLFDLGEVHQACFALAKNGIEAKRVEINNDKRLSNEGKIEALRAEHARAWKPRIAQFRAAIERADTRGLEIRGTLKTTTPLDPTDAVGAAMHSEMRAFVRSLPAVDRARAVLQSESDELRRAVCLAPAELSGLTVESLGRIKNSVVRELNPAELVELEQLAAAMRAALRAVDAVEAAAYRVANLPQRVARSA